MVHFCYQNDPLSMLQRPHIRKVTFIDLPRLNFFKNNIFGPFIKIKESIGTICSRGNMLLIGPLDQIIFGIIAILLSTFRPNKLNLKFFFRISQVSFSGRLFKSDLRIRNWHILYNNRIKSIIISGQPSIKMTIFDIKCSPEYSSLYFLFFNIFRLCSKAYLKITLHTFLNYHLHCTI